MNKRFDVKILDEVFEFFDGIEEKAVEKILFNIRKSRNVIDKELFTKLENGIWEFRTLFNKKKYRVLAFWDKSNKKDTFVIGTNGFIKKTQKTPKKEIKKAERIMKLYFEQKNIKP
jgi:phage-related protein